MRLARRSWLPVLAGFLLAMPAHAQTPASLPETDPWSEPINGLRARMHFVRNPQTKRLDISIRMEVENLSNLPLAISNQPRLTATLTDAAGKPARHASLVAYSGSPPTPQNAIIPAKATLALALPGSVTNPTGPALVSLGDPLQYEWRLLPGRYTLTVTLVSGEPPPPDPLALPHPILLPSGLTYWQGPITLPPIILVLTTKDCHPTNPKISPPDPF